MPFEVVPKRGGYVCKNMETGKEHSKGPISKDKAEAQCRLLNAVTHGFKPTGRRGK